MINYTDALTNLMRDIVRHVPQLSFINLEEVLVFARSGRSGAAGAFATCHCLNLPPTDPGYYYWRDRATGRLTRRSQWFVTKTPRVSVRGHRIKYLLSFALPRFCDQTLENSSKADLYPSGESWLAKLDTVVHELYHIDPREVGLRRITRADGTDSPRSHGRQFYEDVARMVRTYLDTAPRGDLLEFLSYDFARLEERFGVVLATTFRNFPSYPQQYIETLEDQPAEPVIRVVPLKAAGQPERYTDQDLIVRQFLARTTQPAVLASQRSQTGREAADSIQVPPTARAALSSLCPGDPGALSAQGERNPLQLISG